MSQHPHSRSLSSSSFHPLSHNSQAYTPLSTTSTNPSLLTRPSLSQSSLFSMYLSSGNGANSVNSLLSSAGTGGGTILTTTDQNKYNHTNTTSSLPSTTTSSLLATKASLLSNQASSSGKQFASSSLSMMASNLSKTRTPLSTITNTVALPSSVSTSSSSNNGILFPSNNSDPIKSNKRKKIVTSRDANNSVASLLNMNSALDISSLNTSSTNLNSTTLSGHKHLLNQSMNNNSSAQHLISLPIQEYQQLTEKSQQLEDQVQKLKIDLDNSSMDVNEYKTLYEQSKKLIKENEAKCESLKNRNQFLEKQLKKLMNESSANSNSTSNNMTSAATSNTPTSPPSSVQVTIDVNSQLALQNLSYQSHIETTSQKVNALLKQTISTLHDMDQNIQQNNRDYISLFVKQCIGNVIHKVEEEKFEQFVNHVNPMIEIDIPMYQQTIQHYKDQLDSISTQYNQLVEFHQLELDVLKSQIQQLELQHSREVTELKQTWSENTNSIQNQYHSLEEQHQSECKQYLSQIDNLNHNISQYQQLIHQQDQNMANMRCKYEQIQLESIDQLRRLKQTRQDHVEQVKKLKHTVLNLEEEIRKFKITTEKLQIEKWTLYNMNRHLTLRLDLWVTQSMNSDSNSTTSHACHDDTSTQDLETSLVNLKLKLTESLKSYHMLKQEYETLMTESKQTLLRYDELLSQCKTERTFLQEFIQYNMLPYLEVIYKCGDCAETTQENVSTATTSLTNHITPRQYQSILQYMIQHIYRHVIVTDQHHYQHMEE
ncbi:hypothetical protein C9374_002533 [Naegleria lovaniensis]|uniref:Uncharacterized protein n=1 Tax=Naegleria lovaniensis TaxID=51637 RepID=A0AA88GS96_NAELO|nr:uncharacterized protein C9374_002533 [Naegleria lovaniensis]KAG2386087.1 hypothetical protein C9374_002533 [Naegleria lovaniensis]